MIDTHHHFIPKEYAEALREHGIADAGGRTIPDLSVDASLELMNRIRIDTAMLSISTPGVHFGNDAAARKLARKLNEEGGRLKAQYPDRFGFFAVLHFQMSEARSPKRCTPSTFYGQTASFFSLTQAARISETQHLTYSSTL